MSENRMRHTVLLLLLVNSLLGMPAAALALSCAPRNFTLNEAYEAADSIIVGLITECQEETSRDTWTNGGDDCSFTSLEVLKDSTPVRDYSGVTSSSGCGLSLHVGNQYLLFLDSTNQPMWFSAPLSGDHYSVNLASKYLKVIRDFRNGLVNDLAEPWNYGDFEGQCSINQSIRGHQISFFARSPDGPQHPAPDWTEQSIDGNTVYKATVPMVDLDSKLPAGEAKMLAFGNIPDFTNARMVFRVSLEERSPAPPRQAMLSVGNKTWPLYRMETTLILAGSSAHTAVEYYGAGDVAEQILSAMMQPADIVVTATIVSSESAPAAVEPTPPNSPSIAVASSSDDFFGQAAPGSSSTVPSVAPNARGKEPSYSQKTPPEVVLRMESRSTQLKDVIQDFRECYTAEQR